ncbi:short transient receptor potential channel 4-like isoform X2 [Oscarella lobularis]|uniref:short transient receptor potential channel 4-like isoform X2 n=1 Tax=Oscarella lobularis TaxID=121494 RepID=UPI003313DB68
MRLSRICVRLTVWRDFCRRLGCPLETWAGTAPCFTPWYTLAYLDSGESYDVKYVEYLIDKGADLESTAHGRDSPLDAMAENEDMAKALISLVERKRPQLLRKHADSMLRHSVESGSLETVKLLLKKGATVVGANNHGDGTPLIIEAVNAYSSSFSKFSLLLRLGADVKATDSSSENVLHHAARYNRLGIMKRAVELGVSPLKADEDGNLPIHVASSSDDGDNMKCLNFLIEKKSPVNAKNKENESCLFTALQSKATKCVGRLLQAGASLADSKLKYLQYDEVTLLANPQVIMMAPKPIEMTLRLGTLFSKCAKRDESHRGELQSLSESMQSLAVEMMDKADWTEYDITDDLFAYGMENEQKLFISSAPVQEKLKTDWYGYDGELNKRQYVYKVLWFLIKAFLLPFVIIFWLPCLGCRYKRLTSRWMQTEEPCIAYIANAITYLLFIVLLIIDVSLKSNATTQATSPSVLDWIVFVFVVALILQEVSQALGHRSDFKNYITNWSNLFDIFLMLTFVTYYVLLFVGYYAIDDSFEVIRASFHVLGFASLISSVRFLSYLQAHAVLGPIQLSFVGIFYDVVLFLIILGTFLIGFAVSITSVYSAPARSLGAAEDASVPDDVSGMWPSVKILFWSLFGLIDLESFEADRGAETAVGMTLLALWLVLAVIVLLNMLIALISNAFQRVQDNADIEWKFARAVIIHDITKSPPIPIPINILHLIALLLSNMCCKKECCRCKAAVDDDESEYDPADHEGVQEKFREKIEEAEEEEGVRRKDLKKLRVHLDKQISALKAVVQPRVALGSQLSSNLEESESEESDDDGFYQSFLRRHMTSVKRRPAPKPETTDPQAEIGGRRGQKGSRPKPGPKDDDDDLSLSLSDLDDEEKTSSREVKRSSDVSKVPSGAREENIQELLKGLGKLKESFEKLQSDFLEVQTKVISTLGSHQ